MGNARKGRQLHQDHLFFLKTAHTGCAGIPNVVHRTQEPLLPGIVRTFGVCAAAAVASVSLWMKV